MRNYWIKRSWSSIKFVRFQLSPNYYDIIQNGCKIGHVALDIFSENITVSCQTVSAGDIKVLFREQIITDTFWMEKKHEYVAGQKRVADGLRVMYRNRTRAKNKPIKSYNKIAKGRLA